MTTISANDLLRVLSQYPAPRRFWVAYSGGLDSHVLLHHLAQLYQLRKIQPLQTECRIVHVHHNLNRHADDWVDHCRQTCLLLGFSCTILYMDARPPPGASPEEYARQARYTALSALLTSDDEVLLTAHHADDQAETVFLQLLRGAGPAGLAAMPTQARLGQGWLLRPFLNYTRRQLYHYGQQHHLRWIEDSSNTETRYDRNYLRHQVLPKLQARWPSIATTFSRVARHQAEAQVLLETLAQQDFDRCQATADRLYLPSFSQLPPIQQGNLLRYWLKQYHSYKPTTVQLQQILNMMLTAQADRQPAFKWAEGEIRRYRDYLLVVSKLPPLPGHLQLTWQLLEPLALPLGQLTALPTQGQGLKISTTLPLQIRFRQGGERFYLQGHQRSVKKLLQASRIPTWQRSYLPFIYLDDTLIVLPGIGICDNYRVKSHEIGWDIRWETTPVL